MDCFRPCLALLKRRVVLVRLDFCCLGSVSGCQCCASPPALVVCVRFTLRLLSRTCSLQRSSLTLRLHFSSCPLFFFWPSLSWFPATARLGENLAKWIWKASLPLTESGRKDALLELVIHAFNFFPFYILNFRKSKLQWKPDSSVFACLSASTESTLLFKMSHPSAVYRPPNKGLPVTFAPCSHPPLTQWFRNIYVTFSFSYLLIWGLEIVFYLEGKEVPSWPHPILQTIAAPSCLVQQ